MTNAPIEIIKARERSSIPIDLNSVLDDKGNLKFLKQINRGLIEIRQGSNSLVMKIGGIVGRLPVTDSLAIDISPKFPMSNLSRLISISDDRLQDRTEIDRLYETTAPDGFMPELLLRSFAFLLGKVESEGRHRTYLKELNVSTLRPKINFQKSYQQLWSKGRQSEAVVEQFNFSADNLDNRRLKLACRLSLSLSQSDSSMAKEHTTFAHILRSMHGISDIRNRTELSMQSGYFSSIPTFKLFHKKASSVATEIIYRSGMLYENADKGISLPSYLINLDSAFESYIRNILAKSFLNQQPKLVVGDGNLRRWQKYLFDDNKNHPAKPDILIFREREVHPIIVGDVKYKEKLSAEDRYQVITHALSYRAKKAVLITPARRGRQSQCLRIGKIGPSSHKIELYVYSMNLEGDFSSEETDMCAAFTTLAR